jgi:ADP-heptose:LPS heptosyltransferase
VLRAFDPLVLHLAGNFVARRSGGGALSFGRSLDGTRDILIVAARELTDLLAIVPAARALRTRFRLARIHVLASPTCADALSGRSEIFECIPWADEPLLSPTSLRRLRRIRERGFDLVIAVDDGSARRERLLGALSGAKLRLGLHPEGADPFLNLVVSATPARGYAPVHSLEFLSFLGISREQLTPAWGIPAADRAYAGRLLDLRRRGRPGWLLAVDPSPGRGGVRPHPEKLAWLVNRVTAARGALPMILTDGTGGPWLDEFKLLLKTPVVEAPTRGMRDVLAFLGSVGMLLSGNTNLFHFAVALGVPSVALFGREEDPHWVPEDRLTARVLRLSPGERVREAPFLELVDSVREADLREMGDSSAWPAPQEQHEAPPVDPKPAEAPEPARGRRSDA